MKRAVLIVALLGLCALGALGVWLALFTPAAPEAPADTSIKVPSGQPITYVDTVWDQPGATGLTIRFRFVAPEISRHGAEADFSRLETDMQHLCDTFALPRLSNIGPTPSQIIISLSDRPVAFGTADPDATQFFEGYQPDGDKCIWEWF